MLTDVTGSANRSKGTLTGTGVRQGGNSLPRPMPITEKSGARWTSSFPRKHEEYWLGGLNVRTMGSNSDPTTLQNSERHQLYPDTNPLVSNMLYLWI